MYGKSINEGNEVIAEAAVQAGCNYFLAIRLHPKVSL